MNEKRIINIVFRVDGNRSIGIGHISRCLSLARVMVETEGVEISFATKYPEFVEALCGVEFPVVRIPTGADTDREMEVARGRASRGEMTIVFDHRNVSAETLAAARYNFGLVCCIDNLGAARGAADLIFNMVIEGLESKTGRVGGARLYRGARYVILPAEFAEAAKKRRVRRKPVERILVAMGGSDMNSLSPMVVRAARAAVPHALIDTIVGKGFTEENVAALRKLEDENTKLIISPQGILPWLTGADLGVTAGGVTLTEMAALKIPSIVLSQGWLANEASDEFAERGCCIHLGDGAQVAEERLRCEIAGLAADPARRAEMARRGGKLIDCGGSRRIARTILESAAKKKVC